MAVYGSTLLLSLLLACGARHQMKRGDDYVASGQLAAAERSYRDAIVRRPKRMAYQLRLATVMLARDLPEQAVEPARRANEAELEGAAAVLATALLDSGDVAAANEMVERRIAYVPDDVEFLVLRSRIRLVRGDPEGALTAIDAVLALRPEARHQALKAWLLVRAGRYEDAHALALRTLAGDDDDEQVLADTAAVLHVVGDDPARKGAVQDLISLRGVDPERYWARAARRDAVGDRESALRYMAWAVACKPNDSARLAHLGELYQDRGMPDLAIRFLAEALAAPPHELSLERDILAPRPNRVRPIVVNEQDVARILRLLSMAYRQQGQLVYAATALQRAVEVLGSTAPQDWQQVASAWLDAGEYEHAIELGRSVTRDNPRFMPAQLMLARAFLAVDEPALALGHARLAWAAEPGDPEVAGILGPLFQAAGQWEQARAVYEAAAAMHPDDEALRILWQRSLESP